MLTIKAITSAASASQYYSAQDNYYLTDVSTLDESTTWYGKGASDLELSGQVEPGMFLQLLEGRMPSGQQLGRMNQYGELEHRPATDITLSAPKSVSILALVGGDKRLVDVHNKAVRTTLDAIQKMAAEARVTFNGQTGFEKTDNLVVALFQHTTSRELDALLHDHCLIMNMTKRKDNEWRSLSSKSRSDKEHPDNGFREIIYQNQHYFGLIYNSSLAKGACDIGYDIEVKDQYGNFEIKGVPQDFIDKSSKRRQQILTSLSEKGLSSAKAAEKANLDTRRAKESVNSQSLGTVWREEAEKQGVNLSQLIEHSQNKNKGVIEPLEGILASETAKGALNDALEHLSPYRTQIKHAELVRTAYVFAIGTVDHLEIEAEIAKRFSEKEILGVKSDYYTTHDLVRQEKAFVGQCKATLGTAFSIECTKSGLSNSILKTKDRIQLIDVNGLTHEKNLIEDLVNESESQGLRAVVLHVGRLQSNRLSDSINRDASTFWKSVKNFFKADLVQTVSGFSTRYDKANPEPCSRNDLVIVHDAQKLSYKDLSTLERLSSRTDSKLVLLNNIRSTEGFAAGSPIKALKDAGFIALRSKTQEKNVCVDVVQSTKTHCDLAQAYAQIPEDVRQLTLVMALTTKDADSLTSLIRTQLQQKGILSLQTKEVRVLSNQNLSETQKRHSKFYDVGDQITLNPFKSEQSQFKVIGKDDTTLHLQSTHGEKKLLEIQKDIPFLVTKSHKLEFCIGEQLVTERSLRIGRMKFERGEIFNVKAIREDGVMMHYDNADLFLSNEELSCFSLSYNYVKKPNELTRNATDVLVALNSYQLNKNILGELSECSPRIKIFTQDKEKAIEQLDKAQMSWTLSEVAEGKPLRVYRDSVFAPSALNNDLEHLSTMLTASHKDLDATAVAALAVSYTTAKLSERDAAFLHKDLLTQAMSFALGKAEIKDIERAIEDHSETSALIHANTYWISKEALALENRILENNRNEQNTVVPISGSEHLLSLPSTLTQGQKDAISLALTSPDRFVSVQGLAGVGKTTMMRQLQEFAKEKDYAVVGLAPMHTSKDEMIANGIEAMTIAKFLTEGAQFKENTLFIIDEASMIGNRDYAAIQEKIISFKAKALFAGDITQLQSPVSGIPHELTIKTGSQKIAKMTEIVRQKDSPILKKAVIHASNREIEDSFATLSTMNPEQFVKRQSGSDPAMKTSVITINCMDTKTKKNDYNRIYQAIATDYLTRIPEHQEQTLVIAHAHEDRKFINELIRKGLQEQGRVAREDTQCNRLPAKSMTKAELMHAKNYSRGDVVRFDASYSVARKGDYFSVEGISPDSNHLHCTSATGEKYVINPAALALKSRMSVYTVEEAALAIGDKIRLRLTDKARGHIANKEYTIERIEAGRAHLQSSDKTNELELQLNDKKDAHWDYAYSRTAFGAQSATETFVIALELAKRKIATTHRSHEIDITRPRQQVTIYTENATLLKERLAELKGDKVSAYQIKTGENPFYNVRESNKISEEKKDAKPEINTPKPSTNIRKTTLTSNEINELLTQKIESLCEHLFGESNRMSTPNNLRYGAKGSLSINTNNGLWNNFETGEKGNALQLISTQMGHTDFKDTMDYAREFLNHPDSWIVATRVKDPQKTERTNFKDASNKKKYAEKLVNQSVDIKGTLAERYLKEFRKLTDFQDADLRFLPKINTWHGERKAAVPALLCIGKNSKGEINHVQVIRLDPVTGDKDHASNVVKQIYGSVDSCPIELNKKSTGSVTYLTEGAETGLSLLQVNPQANVKALLSKSNFLNVDPSRLTDKIVFCLDNDGKETFKDLIITKAVIRLKEMGKDVSIIMPAKMNNDFDDMLQKEGASAVKSHMENPNDAYTFLEKEIKKAKELIPGNNEYLKKYNENDALIKKITSIENGQIASLKMIENNERNHIKNLGILHKKFKSVHGVTMNERFIVPKFKEQKIMEKEL